MAIHLVTGYKGSAHITSADQGLFNAGCIGFDEYVLASGQKFEASIVNNNTVRIYDGSLLMQGRHVISDSPQEMTITNGSSLLDRIDLIVMRYTKDQSTGVESVGLAVITGEAGDVTEVRDPAYNTDSILGGALTHDMPLYRVYLDGSRIDSVEPLFKVLAPMADIQQGFYKQNMLINGDFQCNQRGKKTYQMSGDAVGYTVDMWRAHKCTVEVRTEGIRLTGETYDAQGYLTQFIQLGKLVTTTYTISAMVDDKIYNFTVTPGGTAKEKDFGKFKISALTISTWDNDLPDFNYYNNKLKVNICPVGTQTINIKYVDVFEGEVAYPHVKEDPATAMMRCRRYIQRRYCYSPILYRVTSESNYGKSAYRFGLSFDPMVSTPTLVACSWAYHTGTSGGATEGSYSKGDLTELTVNVTSADGLVEVTTPFGGSIESASISCAVKANYVVSCEHKPNGDN